MNRGSNIIDGFYSDAILTDTMETTVIQIHAAQLWQLTDDAADIHDASDRISGHVQIVQCGNAGE